MLSDAPLKIHLLEDTNSKSVKSSTETKDRESHEKQTS